MNFLGNKDLSNSIYKISGSYGGIAELYKTKVMMINIYIKYNKLLYFI